MAIKIDTGAVRNTARQIAKTNQKINEDFSSVNSAITNLNNNWDGTASDAAMRKFQNIKNIFLDSRYNVVNNIVNFMNVQIGDGYEKTETSIATAASAFK